MNEIVFSGLIAALVSALIGTATAVVVVREQATSSKSAWLRDRQLTTCLDLLTTFQDVVSAAMSASLNIFVSKVAQAVSPGNEISESENGERLLELAEGAFGRARLAIQIVGPVEMAAVAEEMSGLVLEMSPVARRGADTGQEPWASFRHRAETLRERAIEATRKGTVA